MENVLLEFMKVISKSKESVWSVKIRHLALQKGEARKSWTHNVSLFGKLNRQKYGGSSQKPTWSRATEEYGTSKQLYQKANSTQT